MVRDLIVSQNNPAYKHLLDSWDAIRYVTDANEKELTDFFAGTDPEEERVMREAGAACNAALDYLVGKWRQKQTEGTTYALATHEGGTPDAK